MLISAASGCQRPVRHEIVHEQPAQLFEGLGHHQRAITTTSSDCRDYFNQGLTWAYAFNHDEAIRSFREAARLDPNCAMAWWGVALCNGPHINNPVMTEKQSRDAWDAIQKALALRDKVSYPESQLIEALAKRYAQPPVSDRRPLDEAYAAAMKNVVYELDINDADFGALYAESLMDLQPWDLWTREGRPKGNTEEILKVLEHALKINPQHPGANHLYIHAVEASPNPEKADAAAEVLRTLVPASGHLVHMPSHIDVQVGRWATAADQNETAIRADAAYRKISPKQGFYNVYMAHNCHFLAFAAMMEGRSNVALDAARTMIANVPPDFLHDQPQLADPYMMIALDVLKRFGRWDDILREPTPPKNLPITLAMYHFTRGLAYAAKGDLKRATREQEKFKAAVAKVPPDALMAINPAHKVLSIADHMLAGEIAFRRGDTEEAVRLLREGVRLEDELLYMEPPEWVQPLRHTLGAVLVNAKRYDEAGLAYHEDLKNWPENAWSLFGLAQCLDAQGKTAEAANVRQRFDRAWARADVKIGTSCLCISGG
jgi:tetratricopeptide (TPR) repeat protein